jgi:hypothetical protein
VGRIVLSVLAGLAALGAAGAAFGDDRPAVQAGDTRFEGLAPQQLEAGRCGMFLWARANASDPIFILAAFDNPAEALVRPDGDRRNLPRVSFEGDPVFGHFERQRFSDGRMTLDVDLTFDDNSQINDGAVIKSGVIKLLDANGWETIVPVGGMVACQR